MGKGNFILYDVFFINDGYLVKDYFH